METTRKVKSLIKLSQGIKVDDQEIHIDPTVLFLRILLLIGRSEDPTSYFDYELTPYPTSLFNNRFMRKPAKSTLARELTGKAKNAAGGRKRKLDELNEDDNEENENDESITDESISSADLSCRLIANM